MPDKEYKYPTGNLGDPAYLKQYLTSIDETTLSSLARRLDIDYNSLIGDNKKTKLDSLLSLLVQQRRLPEFTLIVINSAVQKNLDFDSASSSIPPLQLLPNSNSAMPRIEDLINNIANLRRQAHSIRNDPASNENVGEKVEAIAKTADRVARESEILAARMLLPPEENRILPLAPIYLLDKLEEHRSDINLAYLVIGVLVGGIVGLLSNWVTKEPMEFTGTSIIEMIILAIFTGATIRWSILLNSRAKKVKSQILGNVESN